MKVLEISVRVGVTKNIGNFEFARLDYEYRVRLDEGELVADVQWRTREHLVKEVLQDINKVAP